MSEKYDVQQVCENGHKRTGCYHLILERRQKFCDQCGEKTITACPNCDKEIQGDLLKELEDGSWEQDRRVFVPLYCRDCGKPYPWTQRKIATAIQIFTEFGELDDEEKKTIEQDIENIAKDVPDTELSARRINRIWEKYGPVCYEVIMEFASRTAANVLKGP